MSDQTRDQKTPRDFVDPAAWLYLPEAVARELHECARSNGRIDIDYLVAIYRCGREAARAADAQTIATLRAEVERSGDALAIERGLVTIYRNDVERHAQTIATLQDEAAGRLREIGELRSLLASAGAIAERKGEGTAWARFAASVKSLGISPVTARTYRRLDGDGEPESPTVASLRDENARLKAELEQAGAKAIEEHEAALCPEDVGCAEFIATLQDENARLKADIAEQLKSHDREIARLEVERHTHEMRAWRLATGITGRAGRAACLVPMLKDAQRRIETLTAERDAARAGLYHRITGWDIDGQQETKAQDELQVLRDENATLKAESVSEECAVAVIGAARFHAERADAAEAELSTLRTESDRRVREALREGFRARCRMIGTIANGTGWLFDGEMTNNDELRFAAFLAQQQEPKPTAKTD